MTAHIRAFIRVVVFTLVCAGVVAGPPPVAVAINPRMGFEPFWTRARVTIEPHVDNREACFIYDGADYSSSCWELPGDKAPKTTWIVMKDLAGGTYEVVVVIRRRDNTTYQARASVCVVPRFGSFEGCATAGSEDE